VPGFKESLSCADSSAEDGSDCLALRRRGAAGALQAMQAAMEAVGLALQPQSPWSELPTRECPQSAGSLQPASRPHGYTYCPCCPFCPYRSHGHTSHTC
jgi:hypothetical protein